MSSCPVNFDRKTQNQTSDCQEIPFSGLENGEKTDPKKPTDLFFLDAAKALPSYSSRAPLAARFAKNSTPEKSSEFLELGQFYLDKKMYERAIDTFQKALDEHPDKVVMKFYLGMAFAGKGEFKKAADSLSAYLNEIPRDEEALKLRAEMNLKYLKALGPVTATEKGPIERQILADQAMLLALNGDREKIHLQRLAKGIAAAQDGSPEKTKESLAAIDELARQYLQRAALPQAHVEDSEYVRGQLNDLAAQSFELLASMADASPHAEIKKLAPLYNGYRFLAQGDLEAARKDFEKIRKEVPEAEVLIQQMDRDRLKMRNLAALEAWGISIDEHKAVWNDQDNSLAGQAFGSIVDASHSDSKTHIDDFYGTLKVERDLVREVKSRIQKDQAPTIHEALAQIAKEERADFKELAQRFLAKEEALDSSGSYFVAHLIGYASSLDKPQMADTLFRDAEQLEARYGAAQTAFALVSILKADSNDAKFQADCDNYLSSLQNGKDLAGVLGDMIKTTGTDDLVQLAVMAGASKVGSLSKLAALNKLQKVGITGYKAMALAFAAETVAEGTALWAMNTAQEAFLHDANKVFSAEHLAKSYGANLIMVGGAKLSGAAGQKIAPRLARGLGRSSLGHAFGLGGMIATSQANQALGLVETPKGGLQESLARDVFSYVKYGIAQKGVGKVLGKKVAGGASEVHPKVAELLSLFAKAKKQNTGWAKFVQGAKSLALSPATMFLGAGGLGGGFPQFFPEAPLEKSFIRAVHEEVNKDPGLITEIYFTAGEGDAAAAEILGELAKVHSDAFYYLDNLANRGNKTVQALFKNFNPKELSPKLDQGHSKYILAKYGNEAALESLVSESPTDPSSLQMLGWLAVDGNPKALATLGKIALQNREAFLDLAKAASFGNEAAFPLLAKAFSTNPGRAFATFHDLVHRQKNAAAQEFLKNLPMSELKESAGVDWLYLMAECKNHGAIRMLGAQASHDGNALHALFSLVNGGSEAALQQVGELAKSDEAAFRQMVRWAGEKNEGAQALLKSFPVKEGEESNTIQRLSQLAQFGNRQALQQLFIKAQAGDKSAIESIGLLAYNQGDAKAIRLLSALAKNHPEALAELSTAAKAGHLQAKFALESI